NCNRYLSFNCLFSHCFLIAPNMYIRQAPIAYIPHMCVRWFYTFKYNLKREASVFYVKKQVFPANFYAAYFCVFMYAESRLMTAKALAISLHRTAFKTNILFFPSPTFLS